MIRTPKTAFDFEAISIDGTSFSLDRYRGGVMLIVNVASRCGFTPQYRALEDLYRKHGRQGFVVLGCPCDQFGYQEPGTEADIRRFCDENFDVTFPLTCKVDVNGPTAHPLFEFLKAQRAGIFGSRAIKWNFTKFLVGRDGRVVARYGPHVDPSTLDSMVEIALRETATGTSSAVTRVGGR